MNSIHDIPNELLAEIFLHCSVGGLNIPWCLDELPWVLSRVCSRWRHVALGNHELWSNLNIDSDSDPDESITEPDPGLYRMVDEVLSRSGQAPLSLYLFNAGRGVDRWLRPYVHRVRAFGLFDANAHFLSPLADMPLVFPMLEMIELGAPFSGKFEFSMIKDTPKLREVRLYSVDNVAATRPFLLPLSQLTTIEFDDSCISMRDALGLLLECHSLVEFMSGVRDSSLAEIQRLGLPDTHTLSYLESLTLAPNHPNTNLAHFRILNLPRLARFELRGFYYMMRDMEYLLPVIATGSLQSFILSSPDLTIPALTLERLLERSPLLHTLRVKWGTMFSPSVLQRIASLELAPKLRGLECALEDGFSERINLDLHLDALENRKVKGLELEPTANHMPDVLFRAPAHLLSLASTCPRLQRLKEEGWDIVMEIEEGISN